MKQSAGGLIQPSRQPRPPGPIKLTAGPNMRTAGGDAPDHQWFVHQHQPDGSRLSLHRRQPRPSAGRSHYRAPSGRHRAPLAGKSAGRHFQVHNARRSCPEGVGSAPPPRSERGHSCLQQRSVRNIAWGLAGARCLSELAADRNVRAPVVSPSAPYQLGRKPGAMGPRRAHSRRVGRDASPRRPRWHVSSSVPFASLDGNPPASPTVANRAQERQKRPQERYPWWFS